MSLSTYLIVVGGNAAEIERPRIEQRGATAIVNWSTRGEIRNLFAYQVG
jgi:hypothetical protein